MMMIPFPRKNSLGEMIASEFDKAAYFSTDPLEVARMASLAVIRLMLMRELRGQILRPASPPRAQIIPPT